MKKWLLSNLKNKQGFVLIFAMLMIMLLMVFMTAMVATVGYTNKANAEKSDEQQLQLTAQSAVVTLKDMFAQEQNMLKLAGLMGSEQEYDLSTAGIHNKIKAKISDSGQPGYALLTVFAYDGNGNEYTTTALLPMTAAQGGKNDLIENMIVSYWPNPSLGLTANENYTQNVMNGSIIVDNEYYPGKEYYDAAEYTGADKNAEHFDGTYGNKEQYAGFIGISGGNATVKDDPYAVKIKGGTFRELVTTGNLKLDATLPITGLGDTTIASAVGQLAVVGSASGSIGDGSDNIKQIGAGGYFEKKIDDDQDDFTKKTGNILFMDTDVKDSVNIISRDRVNVNLNRVKGKLNNCFIGGKMTYNSASGDLTVANDLQVYKDAVYNIKNGANVKVGGDMASGTKTTMNFSGGGKVAVTGSIATATGDIKVSGSGNLEADSFLSGKGLDVRGVSTKLNGSKGYAAFAGGNYGLGNGYLGEDADARGTTSLSNINGAKSVVVNNKQGNIENKLKVLKKGNDQKGLDAFKTMNSVWLSKAQKVYKGGWWGNGKNVQFAVALLFDSSAVSDGLGVKFSSYISHAADSANNRDESYISDTSKRYDPGNIKVDSSANWQWYEMDDEEYFGGDEVPVSHELGYTTNDDIFLLRSVLQKALGGPTDSTNLKVNATAQGEFVDTARTAIPYDGAIAKMQVNCPHYGNYETAPTVDSEEAGYASITPYADGYLIGGGSSTTGYQNFGRIDVREGGNKLFDGTSTYDIAGKTLYFKTTSPILPGGWGDFYITSGDSETIKLSNKIVIEYTLNSTDAEALSHLGYVRWFLDPTKTIYTFPSFSIEGKNNGSVNVASVDFEYNNFTYKSIMPEFYLFCPKPNEEAKVSVDIDSDGFKGFIIAPWSVIDTRTINKPKEQEVFRGVILCKNFVRADGGTYNHYKPLSFGYAMSDAVFVLPDKNGDTE